MATRHKARRPVGLASLRSDWCTLFRLRSGAPFRSSANPTHRVGKRDRAPELMRGKPRARMRPPGV
ncbi:hypothetical protein AB1K62_07370 [Parasphingorhabdus sp. JC815]|uniref:hypothetical protein n=1 Tax=Parasphingorhabdus sp. JC815 TaxID=3232140 RepID=UPI0034587BE3